MKKALALLLALCLCFTLGMTLVSCDEEAPEHTHTFKTDWSKDATNHWHACEGEGCTEVSEKAAHTWGENNACTVCGQTKTTEPDPDPEVTPQITVTETEWDAMIAISKFDNVTFTTNATFISGYPYAGPHINVFKLDGENGTADGAPLSGESMDALKAMYLQTALAILENYDKFAYDTTAGCYKSTSDISYDVLINISSGYDADITASNVTVKVDANKNLTEITCRMTQAFVDNGNPMTYVLDTIFTFADYGTTVLN